MIEWININDELPETEIFKDASNGDDLYLRSKEVLVPITIL